MTRQFLLVCVALAVIAGCGGTAVRFFIIDPVPGEVMRTTGEAPVVEILDLQVPQYLERPRIATRQSEQTLHFSQQNQWGDNLRKNLARTLARNLAQALDTPDVSSPYNRSTSIPDVRVLVHIERFEQGPDGRVILDAWWQVGPPGGQMTTHRVSLTGMPLSPRDFDAVVGSMRDLYGEFGQQVAYSVLASR